MAVAILFFILHYQKKHSEHTLIEKQANYSYSEGEHLAKKYCGTCHLFPKPSLLDKRTWQDAVLPNMGLRLGIRKDKDPYADLIPAERKIIRKLNIYPEKPLLSKAQWQKIVSFYKNESPTQLPQYKTGSIAIGTQFKEDMVFVEGRQYPKTSLIKFDTLSKELFIGDANNKLYVLNNDLELQSAWFTESTPVDINFSPNRSPLLLTIGSFEPSDQEKGRLLLFDTTGNSQSKPIINIDKLSRPVQFAIVDLNMDGKKDAVICEFGNNRGELAWYENYDPDKKHILIKQPGSRKVIIRDMNHDDKPDLVVLMSQAREEILIFYNLGKGKFKKEKVLQFPPVYGVNYFELVDFNKDGYLDILLTNGDNWDFSPIEKYYHGIRIFLNNGENTFNKKFFFPLSGVSKAVAGDFDRDGDLDIVSAAFYSKKQSPDHNFIYLENKGNLDFKPFYFPRVKGRWLTMEVADMDGDGLLDIVLGEFIHTAAELTQLITSGVKKFPQVVVLHNQIK